MVNYVLRTLFKKIIIYLMYEMRKKINQNCSKKFKIRISLKIANASCPGIGKLH